MMLLEEPLIRVPYETMRMTFKQAQKHIERDTEFVSKASSPKTRDGNKTGAQNIDDMITRMKMLKRKLSTLNSEQEAHLEKSSARVEHLNKLFKSVDSFDYQAWSSTRLDILLVDYFFRSGYFNTALKHIEARKIDKFVDSDVLMQCFHIRNNIRNHRTTDCLSWCQENKAHLKKIRSPLEFQVRLQQFIELVRSHQSSEAIQYCRKHLSKSADTHMQEIQRACALLAFDQSTRVAEYMELYSNERWEKLAELFVSTYLNLHGLPARSELIESLMTGLSVLKTHSCTSLSASSRDAALNTIFNSKSCLNSRDKSILHYRHTPKLDISRAHMCPVCCSELCDLAKGLPYAMHVRSYLDSDPVVLPNGRVCGREKLLSYSHRAGVSEGLVTDPYTGELFPVDELKVIYPS